MPISDEQLQALATLAQLDLDEGREGLRADLERILAYVDRLERFDDPSVAPLRHPHAEGDGVSVEALRPDEPSPYALEEGDGEGLGTPALDALALEALAPAWREGRFKVPRTVDREA